jgi:hypothetical protein
MPVVFAALLMLHGVVSGPNREQDQVRGDAGTRGPRGECHMITPRFDRSFLTKGHSWLSTEAIGLSIEADEVFIHRCDRTLVLHCKTLRESVRIHM